MLAIGDVAKPVFPRSAIKALQALPLVESGAADRYGFGDEELALACASHSGEPAHVAGVERMLAAAGLESSALRCGVHWPISQAAALRWRGPARRRRCITIAPASTRVFSASPARWAPITADYFRPEHPVQREVRAVLEDFTGAVLAEDRCAIDGCSVPTWAVPLENLARGFAKFGTGHGLAPRAPALPRGCAEPARSKPWYVAGTGRFCTEIMQLFGARVFVKTGAEGVYCGALPEQGLGIAIKCDDGAGRAAQAIMAAVIARFLPLDAAERAALRLSCGRCCATGTVSRSARCG